MNPIYLAPGSVDRVRVAAGLAYVRSGSYVCPIMQCVLPFIVADDRRIITLPTWAEYQPAVIDRIRGNKDMGIPDQYYAHTIDNLTHPWGTNRWDVSYIADRVMSVLNGDPWPVTRGDEANIDVVGIGWFNSRPGLDNEVTLDGPLYKDARGDACGFVLPERGTALDPSVMYGIMINLVGQRGWRDLSISLMAAKSSLSSQGRITKSDIPRAAMGGPRYFNYSMPRTRRDSDHNYGQTTRG